MTETILVILGCVLTLSINVIPKFQHIMADEHFSTDSRVSVFVAPRESETGGAGDADPLNRRKSTVAEASTKKSSLNADVDKLKVRFTRTDK